MAAVRDWGEAFLTSISNAFSKLFGFLPDLIGALLILWIGWIIAGILAKLVTNLLRKIHFNEATEKAGLNRFLKSAGVSKDASEVMGEIVKWFFRVIALVAAFSVLQLPALTAALTGILNFIPNLAIALVIILIGGLLANFVGEFVKGAATSAGFKNAGMVSNIARYAILYVAVIAALGQIGVASNIINALFIATVAGLALAFGLAFGLGGRDTAAKIWENTYSAAQENLPKLSDGMKRQAQQTKLQAQQAANNMQPQPQRGPAQYPTPASYNQATQQANYNQGQMQNQTQMQNPPYNYPPASQSQTYPTRQATNYNYTNDQTQPPEQPGQQPPRQ